MKSLPFAGLLAVVFLLAPLRFAGAAIEMPAIFSDGMVLQREMPVPVWGRGLKEGREVVVSLGANLAKAKAGPDGSWKAVLAPLGASAEPAVLAIEAGDERREFKDVLVGEVWLCSGQSNMEWSVDHAADSDLEIAAANRPLLRFFKVDKVAAPAARWTCDGSWRVSTPASVEEFSAVGYRFGVTLQEVLGVPVGLIQAAWGGTPAIAWTRTSALDKHPLLVEGAAEWEREMKVFPEKLAAWEKELAKFRAENGLEADATVDSKKFPNAPQKPRFDPASPHRPGALAAGMMAPIAPYAFRGVIWYQGEADAGWQPDLYDERLAVLFNDWREWFGNPSMAVGIVQLAAFMNPKTEPSDDPWPKLRESQRQFVLSDPKAGIVSAIDAGEADDIHPRNKLVIGRRLARWALADVYGKLSLASGPVPVSARREGPAVLIAFKNQGGGLDSHGSPQPGGFTIAGPDGVFHPAKAAIVRGKALVRVESPQVAEPARVRYAWQNNPVDANLVNEQRVPAPAFEIEVK